MPMVNLDAEEVAVIQTLRDARASADKNASQQFSFGGRDLKVHVFREDLRRWIIRIVVKRES